MIDEILAKSNPKETLQEHTQNLLLNYEKLKNTGYLNKDKINTYDEVIKKLIYFHDLGKLNSNFQNKIRKFLKMPLIPQNKNIDELPHEWLSLTFISKEDRKFFKQFKQEGILFNTLIQYCIAFHHTRDRIFDSDMLEKVVTEDLAKNKYKLNIEHELNPDININDIKRTIIDYFPNYFELLVFLKGILHKCDYSSSAHIEIEQKYKGDYEKDFTDWLNNKKWNLKNYQKDAKIHTDKSIVLIASTGAGKTEYSMNWINGNKAFYLLGIRTAVNEMFKRFKDIFNKEARKFNFFKLLLLLSMNKEDLMKIIVCYFFSITNNVALLHGDVTYYIANESDNDEYFYFDKLNKSRLLSYPLTIATADQIITSVFKYNSFETVYLTASYSHIVVDEIQSFSPESIASIVMFLKEIHKLGGKFLLMTATLPPFIKKEFEKLQDIIFPEPVLTNMKRHRIKILNSFLDDEDTIVKIRNLFKEDKKILILCNTVKQSQKILELLKDLNPNLLHSKFIQKDRKQKEADIMKVGNLSHGVIWISTQIVEASLDIDFDVLFTEVATIDSLFQRFGRCYRNREYIKNDPNIFILKPSKESNRIYDSEILKRTMEVIQSYDEQLLSEQDKQNIINEVFEENFIKLTKYYEKYKNYKDLLELGFIADSKGKAQDMFRNITNNYTIIPEPVYNEYQAKIEDFLKIIDDKNNDLMVRINSKNEINAYCISTQLDKKTQTLLKDVFNSDYCKKNNIKILKGVEYSFEKGLTFIKDYKDYDNFI